MKIKNLNVIIWEILNVNFKSIESVFELLRPIIEIHVDQVRKTILVLQ